jgi:hypothetical protein
MEKEGEELTYWTLFLIVLVFQSLAKVDWKNSRGQIRMNGVGEAMPF